MLGVTVKVWGIMWSVLKKKKKGCSGKDCRKSKVDDHVDIFLNYLIKFCFNNMGDLRRAGFKGGQTGQLPRASTTRGLHKTVKNIT